MRQRDPAKISGKVESRESRLGSVYLYSEIKENDRLNHRPGSGFGEGDGQRDRKNRSHGLFGEVVSVFFEEFGRAKNPLQGSTPS